MSQPLALLRRAAGPSRVFKRHSSSEASKSAPAHALPPHKMRALVSLYHQSQTFITPENLSDRIDEAFAETSPIDDLQLKLTAPGVDTLHRFAREARTAPKFSQWDQAKMTHGKWSSAYSPREWKVIEALYGVDASGGPVAMPGLEALEEGTEDGKIGLATNVIKSEEMEGMEKEETMGSSSSRSGLS